MAPEHEGQILGEQIKRPTESRKVYVAAIAIFLVCGATLLWMYYPQRIKVEPASVDKMEFPLPVEPSIAVLPFANMSGNSEQDYLIDGFTEHIITSLSIVPYIMVIARNSSFAYKGKSLRIQQIAEELSDRYLLEGSLQRSDDRLRITVKLIDAIKGYHLWAEN